MSLDPSSQAETTETSALSRPLQTITRLAVQFPKLTIAIALAVTVAAVVLTATRLGFRNSRADLLNPKSDYHRRWLAYTKEFGDKEDIVVVVEANSRPQVIAVMATLAGAIRQQPKLFSAVMHEYDLSCLQRKGLHYLTPDQLGQVAGFLERSAPILQGDWDSLSIGKMVGQIATGIEMTATSPTASSAEMLGELEKATRMLSAALEPAEKYQWPWDSVLGSVTPLAALGSRPLVTEDGKLGFVMLKLAAADATSFDPHTKGLDALRQIVAGVQAQHRDVQIGLTGLPVIENDEMRASQTSMSQASLLSFVGVAFVFLAGFGGWRHPLIGNVALMAGMAWAFGFATLAIGHLNILSSAFGAILIGQGIDFGVYYLAGYLQQRGQARSTAAALVATAGSVGPGIATGAISTAIAFFAAGFTEFTGVAELGMIAGGGILLCFVAATVLLPALIQLFDGRRSVRAMPTQLELGKYLGGLHARPVFTLLALVAVSATAAVGLRHLWYDHNLMNLQPAGLESVRLGKAMTERTGQNAYFAISMANNREEALARKEAFSRLPSVARVEEIASAVPNADPRRQPMIEQIRGRLSRLPSAAPQISVATADELGTQVAKLASMLPNREETREISRRLASVRESIGKLSPAEVSARVGQYQQRLAGDVLERLQVLQSVSDPLPPQLSDLPDGLRARFVGQTGKHLLKIYGKADIWDMAATQQFIREVRGVDADATGNPMQIYEASRQMRLSYEQAAVFATVIVCYVVYLDFNSIRYTLLALLPLALGMLQMFGIMGLVNIPLNSANMIVLPLILGIGVDNGVHVVHDFRAQRGRKYRISDSTANAVFINTLGNMVGFGSLMIASHQGLQSLGRVLTLGMACCLFSALTLPGLLVLISRFSTKVDDSHDWDEEDDGSEEIADYGCPHYDYRSRDAAIA